MSELDELNELEREKLHFANPEKRKVDEFLDLISQIESSGGKNTDHPVMESGIHEGQQAIGRYGLMPNTIKELTNRAALSGNVTQPMRKLASEEPLEIKQQLEQNPQMEESYARQLALKILNRQQDPEKAAYSWNQGHNLSPEDIDSRDYQNSDYVQKFQRLKQQLAGNK